MEISISNCIRIPLAQIGEEALEDLKARLTFPNPAYREAVGRLRAQGKFDAKPYGVPERIFGWGQMKAELIVPRGCAGEIIDLLEPDKVVDRTRRLSEVKFGFDGLLKPAQVPAVEAVLARRFGTLSSPTGSGKTVMGLWCIAQRKQPALVVVHTAALMKQWVERATHFLGIPEREIGIIGQGQSMVGKRLTIALVQTLRKCAAEVAPKIGHLVVDECHHVPAAIFRECVAPFDCAYMLGLSATHKRRDGLTQLIYWHVGPLVYEVGREALIRAGDIVHVEPVIRETAFEPSPAIDPVWQRAALMKELTEDVSRNIQIAKDIQSESEMGSCIVLTDRKAHAEELVRMLGGLQVSAEVCHGGVPRPEQEAMIRAMNDGRLRVLVATGQLLGEGFDCKRLTALFLATPIKFSGRLIQYLGRVARSSDGKAGARVYDYHDVHVDVLMKAARERLRTYKKLERQAQEIAAPTFTLRKGD